MKIEKILFPTKFGELAFNALESLLTLKYAGLREVVLYHVIPRDEVGFVPFGGYLKEEEERLREEKRIQFEDWQHSLSAAGVNSKIVIDVGDPVPSILSMAEREQVGLMVVGRKKIGPEMSFLGSHTLQLITRSPVPTLVSKHLVEFDWEGERVTRINDKIFKSPLLATDWSGPSEKALDLLISLVGVVEKAYLGHVIGADLIKDLDKAELHRIEIESRERLERSCARLKSAGIAAEPHLGVGGGPIEIIRISREVEASMIIMGTTGKDRLRDLFLGSSSHQVAQSSELPVLLVP